MATREGVATLCLTAFVLHSLLGLSEETQMQLPSMNHAAATSATYTGIHVAKTDVMFPATLAPSHIHTHTRDSKIS